MVRTRMSVRCRICELLFSIVFVFLLDCRPTEETKQVFSRSDFINFSHLDGLCEDVVVEGDSVTIVHIYSNYPDYEWVEAEGEGISCVDDVARAAVVYLRYYEITGDTSVCDRLHGLLDFVLLMQTDDGEFYNFIDKDLRINRVGVTSRKSFNFWAARAYWALGYGFKVLRLCKPDYAAVLRERFLLCKLPIHNLLKNYRKFRRVGQIDYPLWLVNGSGSDATSELLLGLGSYLEGEQDAELKSYALKLAEGLLAMQSDLDGPFSGVFLSWINLWHAWGNSQTEALAVLSRVLENKKLISAAEKEASLFYPHLIQQGFFHSFSIKDGIDKEQFPQIAYDLRTIGVGLVRLYEVTGKKEYGEMAGLVAAWFFGRNIQGRTMYDVKTGRCYDGIEDSTNVNLNSGAESTVEALFCLLEVISHPFIYESMVRWINQSGDYPLRELLNVTFYYTKYSRDDRFSSEAV